MWQNQLALLQIFLLLYLVFCFMQGSSNAYTGLCAQNSVGEETEITCSCLSNKDTIIIQDVRISSSNKYFTFPSNTTLLQVGQCQAIHLSGPTLTSLLNIHILHLHDIDMIHISYDFFLQYKTRLKVLQLSSSGFTPLQNSLNIHAHRLSHILFDKILWNGELNLLLQTEENELPEVFAIQNSRIKILGEINISSRYIKKVVLQNNTIGKVLTSAFIQDSQDTLIENNNIDSLSFLSLDSNTHHFTFKGNIIKSLALQSLVVNNATKIIIINNTFVHIERHGLTWLHLTYEGGSLVFSGNQLYAQGEGSLTFSSTVLNENLEIENNIMHTEACNCNILRLLDNMTAENNVKKKRAVYELFEDSTLCCDKDNKIKRLKNICAKYANSQWNWEHVLLFVAVAVVIFCGFSVFRCCKGKQEVQYKILSMEETTLTMHCPVKL